MFVLMALSLVTVAMRLLMAMACAPLSFRRETMRSPYSGHSLGLRAVNLYGHVGYDGGTAVSSGFGVRPALLSERNYAFAVPSGLKWYAIC